MIMQVNTLSYILEYGNVIWGSHCVLDQCKLEGHNGVQQNLYYFKEMSHTLID